MIKNVYYLEKFQHCLANLYLTKIYIQLNCLGARIRSNLCSLDAGNISLLFDVSFTKMSQKTEKLENFI